MRLRVGVLLGGRSGEHEVSVLSAGSILAALDRSRFDIVPIGITGEGRWLLLNDLEAVKARGRVEEGDGTHVYLAPEPMGGVLLGPGLQEVAQVDVVFPVLHGTFGEDGTVQGLLEMACVPYVGAGVLASSVGMDKAMMKVLFQAKGIPTVRFSVIPRRRWRNDPGGVCAEVEDLYGYPVFVKPANLGSSVGVTKAKNRGDLEGALETAALYDTKMLVEEAAVGREVECGVLGNGVPEASIPGEIIPCREFYDYNAKYIDGRSELLIPAPLPPGITQQVQELSLAAFRAIDCSGMARVDFFITETKVLVNEINTIPGFTSISAYPKMWEASGIPYSQLLSRLVDLAMERHDERASLVTSYKRQEPGGPL